MKLVCVEWIDSCIQNGQIEIGSNDVPTPSHITTVGVLVRRTKAGITVARDTMHGDIRGTICIPACCIKRVRKLTTR